MSEVLNSSFQPVNAKERIVFLDILRGFALFGILFANLLTWSGLKYLPIEDIRDLGNFEVDRTIYRVMKFFVDTKFIPCFLFFSGLAFIFRFPRTETIRHFPGFICGE
jgi:uncharacterized protein